MAMANIKAGARNNAEDRIRIRGIRKAARDIQNITMEIEPTDDDPIPGEEPIPGSDGMQALVTAPIAAKALGDMRVGGYLVMFGDEESADFDGDFFTRETDFGDLTKSRVLYDHGMDSTVKRHRIGTAELGQDDVGVWIKSQLDRADEYARAVYKLVEMGKLGWSSGTAAHLVERERKGKAAWVKSWALGLDASLTPSPMDPRNRATVKSLKADKGNSSILRDALAAIRSGQSQKGDIEMNDEQVTALTNGIAQNTKAVEMLTAKVDGLAMKSAGGFVEMKVADVNPMPYLPLKAGGFGQFLIDVKNATGPGGAVSDRLSAVRDMCTKAMKATGMNEAVGSEGGFFAQPDHEAELLKLAYDSGILSSRTTRRTVQGNGTVMYGRDETSRATGSRWGGVQGYRGGEASTITATKPSFRRMELRLKKFFAAYYSTDELLMDAPALSAEATEACTSEIAFMVDDDIFAGNGANGPLGFMAGGALITVAKESGQAANTILFQNIIKMWARRWGRISTDYIWLINQDIETQLYGMSMAVGTGGVPVYMPSGGLSGLPYSTLMGRPVIPCEFSPTLGTTGDIALVALSQYKLIEKGGIQSASSIHVAFLTDETVFRFTYRVDGQPIWNAPLTPYKGSNTMSPFIVLATRA